MFELLELELLIIIEITDEIVASEILLRYDDEVDDDAVLLVLFEKIDEIDDDEAVVIGSMQYDDIHYRIEICEVDDLFVEVIDLLVDEDELDDLEYDGE